MESLARPTNPVGRARDFVMRVNTFHCKQPPLSHCKDGQLLQQNLSARRMRARSRHRSNFPAGSFQRARSAPRLHCRAPSSPMAWRTKVVFLAIVSSRENLISWIGNRQHDTRQTGTGADIDDRFAMTSNKRCVPTSYPEYANPPCDAVRAPPSGCKPCSICASNST